MQAENASSKGLCKCGLICVILSYHVVLYCVVVSMVCIILNFCNKDPASYYSNVIPKPTLVICDQQPLVVYTNTATLLGHFVMTWVVATAVKQRAAFDH